MNAVPGISLLLRSPSAHRAVVSVAMLFAAQQSFSQQNASPWNPDNGDGTFSNPVLFADYSDPDVVRAGNDFYLVSSSFQCAPGIPVLRSHDLVNWTIVGHVFENFPDTACARPQYGRGCWAPSIRFHDGKFFACFGDPDRGIFMTTAQQAEGPWSAPVCIRDAKGWIDPCPLWDDDGNAYLVHAWAKSRAGFNAILTMHRMSPDGMRILDDGTNVFEGRKIHPTIEGPKFYKRNGFYYIFAPAGGVKTGWQTVLRSRNVFGPYEDRIVLHQGATKINGPHQGAWVDAPDGRSWFIHFQDRGAYGRVVHLQPMRWENDWPVMGEDVDGDGVGEPVMKWKKPDPSAARAVPQTSDEFDSTALGLQWQWNANHRDAWYSLSQSPGHLRLFAVCPIDSNASIGQSPNLLMQKFPAPDFVVRTSVTLSDAPEGTRGGLCVMGRTYAAVELRHTTSGLKMAFVRNDAPLPGGREMVSEIPAPVKMPALLQLRVSEPGTCEFAFSTDGKSFTSIGEPFTMQEGSWIGARVGLYALAPGNATAGFLDVDWFRVSSN